MTTLDDFRKEVFTILQGAVLAERAANARIAKEVGGAQGLLIARRIQQRPALQLPPLSLGLKDIVIGVINQGERKGGKR